MAYYIFFNSRDELLRVNIAHIIYIESDGNYTHIVQANGLRSTVNLNLLQMEKTLEQQLGENARRFVRLGKRHIVNLHFIYKINVARQLLILSDTEHFMFQLKVSKEALRTFKDLIVGDRDKDGGGRTASLTTTYASLSEKILKQ